MTSPVKHARAPRLGKGLSTLMGQPVHVHVPTEQVISSDTTAVAIMESPVLVSPALAAGMSTPAEVSSAPSNKSDGLLQVPIQAIRPNPFQPRQQFDQDALNRLADSIKAAGLMQPVIVRPSQQASSFGPPAYELVAGERRWRAAQIAGLKEIPALLRVLDDRQLAEWALIENLQREDLNPLERASAFQKLLDQFKLTHDQIAQRVGVDRSTISNSLRLLNLHQDVQNMIRHSLITAGQAKALAGLSDLQQQVILAQRAVRGDWSVRQLETAVRNFAPGIPGSIPGDAALGSNPESDPAYAGPKPRAAHFRDMEEQIGQQLGTKVRLHPGRKKGAGSLTIEFYTLDQFDALLARLGVKTE